MSCRNAFPQIWGSSSTKCNKEHTDSFLQSAALLSQFDGMNITERSLIAEHFTVDGSHHELLHLPLWKRQNVSHYFRLGPISVI